VAVASPAPPPDAQPPHEDWESDPDMAEDPEPPESDDQEDN
jgi:hypothetical protein